MAERKWRNSAEIQRDFGVGISGVASAPAGTHYRIIRPGEQTVIFTIGYEKRDGEGLIALLQGAGVEMLADIRGKPFSRVPDFREAALRGYCENARIQYSHWPKLGSTEQLRDALKSSGDFSRFERGFRKHMKTYGGEELERLAGKARSKPTALLCYERLHEDCHRSIVAEMLADLLDAGIVAI